MPTSKLYWLGTFALNGHQVFKAFNADQCLEIITELNNQVDVIVMDGKTEQIVE